MNYGRKGLAIQAMSSIDLAIWDALGRHRGRVGIRTVGGEDDGAHAVLCHHEPSGLGEGDGILRCQDPVAARTGEWGSGHDVSCRRLLLSLLLFYETDQDD